jgi:hypothetical protein
VSWLAENALDGLPDAASRHSVRSSVSVIRFLLQGQLALTIARRAAFPFHLFRGAERLKYESMIQVAAQARRDG